MRKNWACSAWCFTPARTWATAKTRASRGSSKGIDAAHGRTPGYKTLTLVEGTAGQGTALGYRFEHLQAMLEGAGQPERLAFCLDTCHLFAAGYDLRTEQRTPTPWASSTACAGSTG